MKTPSFNDIHGGTVTVAPEDVPLYLGVKAEQLSALTQLMTNVELGAIEIGAQDREVFQLMTNEYAKAVQDLVEIANGMGTKGGVK